MAVRTIDAAEDMRVPVIDLGPYLAGERGALERAAEEVQRASETIGFYFLENHGVRPSLADRVFAEAERFHHLPDARKNALSARSFQHPHAQRRSAGFLVF